MKTMTPTNLCFKHFFSIAVLLLININALAQQTITPNYRDVEIRSIIEGVSNFTGKNFIIDPRIQASDKATMVSSSPMTADAFYQTFLSLLQVHGFVAVQAGEVIKIVPDASSRQYPSSFNVDSTAGDDLVTHVVKINDVSAAQLVPILRPLVPQYGHLAAHPASNIIIISDRSNNVKRIISIINKIDLSSDNQIEIISLDYASASDIVRVLNTIAKAPRSDGLKNTTTLGADSRTNSVLLGGNEKERLRIRALIAHLDTPLDQGEGSRVRYLRYANAEDLAEKLKQHFSNQQNIGVSNQANTTSNFNVWADAQTNAIVVNAPPKIMKSIMSIIDQLDIRRSQVLVEAIIVEVIADKTSELGITWGIDGTRDGKISGATNFPDTGSGVVQLGAAAAASSANTLINSASLIGQGMTLGIGRLPETSQTGTSFASILRALEGIADTNIISTPSIVTTDNEEASLNVGQEVPFVTGSFSNAGTTGVVNPFQTIQRQQVGVKLTITPQINEGNSMLMKISQEISSIAQSSTGAVDLITNQRTIDTTVIVDDGEILVLGGLLEDQLRESNQRVPILGSIPILGALFRSTKINKVKTNLMVFIRPTILHDATQASAETNTKYNYIRNLQLQGKQNLEKGDIFNKNKLTLPALSNNQNTTESQ